MSFFGRILRYAVVGTTISVIYSITVVTLVDGFYLPSPTIASMMAFAIMLPAAYVAHRYVTFSDTAPDPFQPWRFVATATVSFAVATIGIYVLTEILGHSYYLGIALNWLLIPGANFLIYLIWVFRTGSPSIPELSLIPRGISKERRSPAD